MQEKQVYYNLKGVKYMNINGLGNIRNYATQKLNQVNSGKTNDKFSVNPTKTSSGGGIHLTIGGLASCGTADGTNVTVYKSDSYTADNPELKIVTTLPNGEKSEKVVNALDIDPSHATESEMLALHSYLVDSGKTDVDISHTGIIQGTSISGEKMDYMAVLKELMMMQYNAHNLQGYAKYKDMLGVYDVFMDKYEKQH